MKHKFNSLSLLGAVLLLSLIAKSSWGCGGMVFPGSLICTPTASTVTASLIYVPTSWLGGGSQPISYPPNPLAPKSSAPNS
ncbi:MAG: hypothetical protein ACKN9V_02695, partial [Pseudomonadota bacterium]